jgi:hypothetical protein
MRSKNLQPDKKSFNVPAMPYIIVYISGEALFMKKCSSDLYQPWNMLAIDISAKTRFD